VFYVVQGFFYHLFSPFALIFLLASAVTSRFIGSLNRKKNRVVFGSTPIISNSYWAKALRKSGYSAETFTDGYYKRINVREDWDRLMQDDFRFFPRPIQMVLAFAYSLFKYDIFVISFQGFFLGNSPLSRTQSLLFRIAKKKTVVIPYGADAYVYRRVRSTSLIQGLMLSYRSASRIQDNISRQVDYWCKYADVVVGGIMGFDGLGRWDVLTPSPFCIDTNKWVPRQSYSEANGIFGTVRIGHAPNHRGFKGTEFLESAVEELINEGLKVELCVLEGMQNEQVKNSFQFSIDILVEQLIATGYAFNAIEGMASGIPTISNLEDPSYTLPLRRWTFFQECPIISASPETIKEVLRALITNPEKRANIGRKGRDYVETFHSFDFFSHFFESISLYLDGQTESIPDPTR
jgi:hypothetical protein